MHKIHLSVGAQIYSIVLGPTVAVFCQNDCILSYYRVEYGDINNKGAAKETEAVTESEPAAEAEDPEKQSQKKKSSASKNRSKRDEVEEEKKEDSQPQKAASSSRVGNLTSYKTGVAVN